MAAYFAFMSMPKAAGAFSMSATVRTCHRAGSTSTDAGASGRQSVFRRIVQTQTRMTYLFFILPGESPSASQRRSNATMCFSLILNRLVGSNPSAGSSSSIMLPSVR